MNNNANFCPHCGFKLWTKKIIYHKISEGELKNVDNLIGNGEFKRAISLCSILLDSATNKIDIYKYLNVMINIFSYRIDELSKLRNDILKRNASQNQSVACVFLIISSIFLMAPYLILCIFIRNIFVLLFPLVLIGIIGIVVLGTETGDQYNGEDEETSKLLKEIKEFNNLRNDCIKLIHKPEITLSSKY